MKASLKLPFALALAAAAGSSACSSSHLEDFARGLSKSSVIVTDGDEVLAQSVIIDGEEVVIYGDRYDPRARRAIRTYRAITAENH